MTTPAPDHHKLRWTPSLLATALLTIAFPAVTSSVWGQALAPAPFAPMSLAETPATDPAADTSQPVVGDDSWKFSLSVPLWLPAVNGDVTIRDRDLSV